MKKSSLLLTTTTTLLLSSPERAISFCNTISIHHPAPRLPSQTATMPLQEKAESLLAYSFRQPEEEDYLQESKMSILLSNTTKNGGSDNNGSNDGGGAILFDNDEMDIVGSGTLGDIMSGLTNDASLTINSSSSSFAVALSSSNSDNLSSKVIDGLVTKEGGELNNRFRCNFSPMERIALTSNGNLQRIFSSYYDAPVHVHIDFCSRRATTTNHSSTAEAAAMWDRVVHIHIHGQTICKATSVISVKDPACIRLIENGTIGLGQLFRYLNRLPTFSLVDAGRRTRSSTTTSNGDDHDDDDDALLFDGGIWRKYELKCEEMTCFIHEQFHKDAWSILPLSECETNGCGDSSPFQPLI